MTREPLHFRLYVVGTAPHSRRAIANLRMFCETTLDGRYDIEVVDLLVEPARALQDKVLLTPTLAMLAGGTTNWIVGDLSDTAMLRDIAQHVQVGI